MKEAPLFSLLIATVRRRTELENLLFTLRQQQYQHLQIIIADQNPPSFLEGLYAQFPDLPLQIIPVPDKGVSQARNAIIPLAEGSYIAFPDDDCWYAPDTLAQVVEAFQRHPGPELSWATGLLPLNSLNLTARNKLFPPQPYSLKGGLASNSSGPKS